VGFGVVILFFAIKSPLKFIFVSVFFSFLFALLLFNSPSLNQSLEKTINDRIFGKTEVFEKEDESINVGELYSDLGAGRDQLTINNINYLLGNPEILPLEAGFVNRNKKGPGPSAHNMYLQVIKETGLVGFFLYFGWLVSYLFIKFDKFSGFSLALQGLIWAMLVSLFFGEHLYIYRPLFGLLGLFLMVTVIFVSALHKIEINNLKDEL